MHELQMFLSHRLILYSTLNIAKTLKCPNDNIVFLCSEKFNFWRVNIELKKGASENLNLMASGSSLNYNQDKRIERLASVKDV